ncbi:MAG: hypothetical protein Q6367_014535, partial [Candidatus Freyarchaeota archaeon]
MNKYKLNFYSWQKNSDPDVKKSTILLVSVGPITFPVKIQMSRTLFNSLISVLPESEIEKRMLLVGLPRLKTKLKYADVPTTSSGNIPLEENFTSDHYDLFMEEIP